MLQFIYDWTARAELPACADAIFVLAGHKNRKTFAIQLLDQGMAARILFSVGRFEIRRFAELGLPQTVDLLQLAQSIPPPLRHFFVLFEKQQFTVQRIPVRTLGTLSEIDALADWLGSHPEITTLLAVSSGPHLRRVRMCCRILLPPIVRISFLASPESRGELNSQNWWKDAHTRKIILSEWLKIPCYLLFLPLWKFARRWRSQTLSSFAPE
jgi:uncharacterized SAM-binding protein YcdF (DUF218 family)